MTEPIPEETEESEELKEPEEPIELSVLEQMQRELGECKEKYVRLLAESENQRKRLVKDRQDSVRHAIADALLEFLRPIDHLEDALRHAESSSPEVKNWCMGFEMILGQFRDALATFGVRPIETDRTQFDPHLHEAVEMVETSEHSEGTIVQELLRGYTMNDRLLRAARVKVAKAPSKPQEELESDQQETNQGG